MELKEMPSGFVLNDYMIYENEQGEFLFENTRGNVYVPEKESVEVVDLVENIYLDSKYFDFNELKIDFKESRGLLIKSENYQALNYLDNIVKGEVDLIRIDPPFNTNNDQFYYKDDYLDSSWLSLMADRINLSSRLGSITSSTYIHLDENGEHFMRIINDDNLGFKRTLFWNSGGVGFKGGDNWIRSGDIINYFSNKPDGNPIWNPSNNNERNSNFINSLSVQDSWFNNKENLGSFWRVKGTTQKTEDYVSRYIFRSSNEDSYVMDYFMGTGTIPAICHKTGRKYLGIDMGEHFDLIAIKRMKKVLIGDLSGISNDIDENGNKREGGGVFTYLYLNQYEDRFNAGGYLDQIEGDMTEFSNIDVATITDIKQILFPLSELKETIYGLDD